MTLILSLANALVSLQIADGRLTRYAHSEAATSLEIDDSVKCGALTCGDARLAYGFTGLAYTGTFDSRTFDTRSWLRVALLDAAKSSVHIQHILANLRDIASTTFKSHPGILSVTPKNRRLSVMLNGFWNTNAGCIPAGWILTNFQNNFDLGTGAADSPEAEDEFRVWQWHQSVPTDSNYAHVERLGDWRGVGRDRLESLHTLLLSDPPIRAIAEMGIAALREASTNFRTSERVGREALIIIIHKNNAIPIQFANDAASTRVTFANPDVVIATDPQNMRWLTLELEAVPTPDNPFHMSVPKVHRNAPCPCGSRLRYRDCHKPRRPSIGN